MNLDRDGALLIAKREAIVLVAYQDGEHYSIGLGSNDPSLKAGDTITVAEAFARFKRDIAVREQALTDMLRVVVDQDQFNALFSLYYQSGNRNLRWLLPMINANAPKAVVAQCFPIREFSKNKAGEYMAGLEKRRRIEAAVYERGDYGEDPETVSLWRGDPRKTKPETYRVKPGDL